MSLRKDIFESYALFHGIDETIFLLNPTLEKHGYTFIRIGLDTFEKDFVRLFLHNPELKSGNFVRFDNGITISEEFYSALFLASPIGMNILTSGGAYLLKSLTTFNRDVLDGKFTSDTSIEAMSNMHGFVAGLMTQLRLLTKGNMVYPYLFQSAINNRELMSRYNTATYLVPGNPFNVTPKDAEVFSTSFSPNFEPNKLTQLAISNFLLIYQSPDQRTKFIVLMMCLECMFNNGRDQITHTVSRHLALILSNTKEEFLQYYKEIKKLYGIRSQLIHGDYPKKQFHEELERLEDITRIAINYCRNISLTKDEFFEELNTKGFA